ncbi:MAG TPA: hypothetical protein VLT58_01555 [Polyangia bacterium]|nr:hypothetical protein [Polyangia bacterium]
MAPESTVRRVGAPLGLLCAFLGVLVATPWSSARAAQDTEEPKAAKTETETAPQAEDTDRPRDKSLLAPKPADAAVAQKAQEDNTAFYEKWQFWAIAGGIAVVAAAAVYGGFTLYHSLNGGDVRPCNKMFLGCYGQGEPGQ